MQTKPPFNPKVSDKQVTISILVKSIFYTALSLLVLISCNKETDSPPEENVPVILLTSVDSIPSEGADVEFEIQSLGDGLVFSDYGLVWGVDSFPGYNDFRESMGDDPVNGNFIRRISNCIDNSVHYFVRAYLRADNGNITYSNSLGFTGVGCRAPEILSFTPDSVDAGAEITIMVENLNSNPLKNTVLLGTMIVEIISTESDRLVFEAPSATFTIREKISVKTGSMTVMSDDELIVHMPWTIEASFPYDLYTTPRTAVINNIAYIFTYANDVPGHNILRAYNPITNIWTARTDFPGEFRWNHTSFTINNKAYFGLGWDYTVDPNIYYKDFYEYNPETDTWKRIADFPGTARLDCIGFASNGKGYVAGGSAVYTGENTQKLWEYDPETDQWTQKNALNVTLDYSVNAGGTDYVANHQGTVYLYNEAGDTFNQITSRNSVNRMLQGFSLNNAIYFFEENTGHTLWKYNLGTNQWAQSNLSYPFQHVGDAVVFSIGNTGYCLSRLDDAHLYSYRTDSF